jgi:hypothetical protein
MSLAALSLDRASFSHGFEFALESRDPFLDTTTVHFQLCFTRASRADAARLPR